MSAAIHPTPDVLLDEIRRLRALVVHPVSLRRALRLQPMQEDILRFLIASYPNRVTAIEVFQAVTGNQHMGANVIASQLSRMRSMAQRSGITVTCVYTQGYVLTAESHMRLLRMVGAFQ